MNNHPQPLLHSDPHRVREFRTWNHAREPHDSCLRNLALPVYEPCEIETGWRAYR